MNTIIKKNKASKLLEIIQELAERIYEEVQKNGEQQEQLIDESAAYIESITKFKIKDYKDVLIELGNQMNSLITTNTALNHRELQIISIERNIITYANKKRTIKNRENINRVEGNAVAAGMIAGLKQKEKTRAENEGTLIITKKGLRTVRYENANGKVLSWNDIKILTSLFSIWKEQDNGENEDWFRFTIYKLLDKMGQEKSGPTYNTVIKSLATLSNTKLIIEDFFEITENKYIFKQSFPIFVTEGEITEVASKSNVYMYKFHENITKSFNNGYTVFLSLGLLNELDSDVSKGLYTMISFLKSASPEELRLKNIDYGEEEGYYYEVDIDIVYEYIRLASNPRKNKFNIKESCAQLKQLDILDNYFIIEGEDGSVRLRMYPSEWFNELHTNVEENISNNVPNEILEAISHNKKKIEPAK